MTDSDEPVGDRQPGPWEGEPRPDQPPAYGRPQPGQPGAGDTPPGWGQPGSGLPPGWGQPGYGQPGYGQPGYGQPPPGWGQPQWGSSGYGGYPQPRGTNGFAIASLICAFLCSPLGLIFGFIARSQIKNSGEDGAGLALAGIIISAVLLVGSIIWFVIVAAVVGNTTLHCGGNGCGTTGALAASLLGR
jgi:hypothetical protein